MMSLDIAKKLSTIAEEGGFPWAIDSPAEWREANAFLETTQPADESEELVISQAWELLQSSGPRAKFQINSFFQECSPRGCYSLLVPLPSSAAIGFFIFSGIGVPERVQFVSVDSKDWQAIKAPLQSAEVKDPASERKQIAQAALEFEKTVSPSGDVAGYYGNYVQGEDQQSCVHKRLGVLQLLSALEMAGLLKHHHVDLEHPKAGTEFFHVATRLRENGSNDSYVVDTWREKGKAEVWPEGYWKAYYAGFIVDRILPKNKF